MALNTRFLLIDHRGKKYLTQGDRGLETDLGIYQIPRDPETPLSIESHLGHPAVLVEPSLRDYVERMDRPTRTLHFEDIGYIITRTGLRQGQTAVEAGTGSGCSTLFLSRAVGPSGRVISFERRPSIHRTAADNIEGFGCRNVELVNSDLAEMDRALTGHLFLLDLARPSKYVESAFRCLVPGGFLVAYAPFIEEARDCLVALTETGAMEPEMCELVKREYETRKGGTRPRTTQTVHTGYMVLGRRGIGAKTD